MAIRRLAERMVSLPHGLAGGSLDPEHLARYWQKYLQDDWKSDSIDWPRTYDHQASAGETNGLAMTDRGVNAFLSRSIEFGNGTRIAIAGRADDVDILSFAVPGGARSSPSLEHAIITACKGLNQAIYGRDVTPADIIIRGTPRDTSDAELGPALVRLARRGRETQRRQGSLPSLRPAPAPATLR